MKNIRTSAVQVPLLSACMIFMTMCTPSSSPPTGVEFDLSIFRSGDNGDNWFVTWAGSGDLYTSQCDGRGWRKEDGNQRDFMNNRVWRISGGPDSASFSPRMDEGAPDYSRTAQQDIYGPIEPGDSIIEFPPAERLDVWNWYGYGIISVDGNIYQFISHCG